jgi:cytochrome c oxidase cbb3-type subunit I
MNGQHRLIRGLGSNDCLIPPLLERHEAMQTEVTARHSHLSDEDSRALISVFSAYTIAATLWLLFATGVGLLIAFKFGAPEFGTGAWLTFGRLRPIHTNATFYGFASIALVGLGYYVAVRSSGAKLYSAPLAQIGLVLFNAAALAGTIALDLGYIDGDLEYREWPWWIRLIFLAALAVTAWNLIGTVARRSSRDVYLSNWYIIGGTVWAAIISVLPFIQSVIDMQSYYVESQLQSLRAEESVA